MDFALSEEQEAVAGLAEQIFQGRCTVERVKKVEAFHERIDRELWADLATANLLGICLPADDGGNGLGMVELCLLLEQQGRVVAPVPLLATLSAATTIAEHGTPEQRATWLPRVIAGEAILTAALEETGDRVTVEGGRATGARRCVPAAHVAARVLVPAGGAVWLVDPAGPGVIRERAETTDRGIVCHLALDGAPAERLGTGESDGAVERWLRERVLTGLCALQVGVAEAALRMAAGYTSGREQFGKPLSTFQGVALKAADAYIDIEAMRTTMWQAAWRLSAGLDATGEVLVAKWWAADAGERVVHTTQHLHGGIGADVEYPVHRYFLWGKQLADTLGGASATLAALGDVVAGVGA